MATTKAEEAARLKCYRQGMCDRQIGAQRNVSGNTISHWRRTRNLPINRDAARSNSAPRPLVEEDRLAAYRRGMSDGAIGKLLGIPKATIYAWRIARGLPAHSNYQCNDNRRELYDSGMLDHEIAHATGRTLETIQRWRQLHGWPSNRPLPAHRDSFGAMSPEATARRMLLYQLGWNDAQIAREEGGGVYQRISKWRIRLGLPANAQAGRQSQKDGARPPTMADLLRRVRRAIGFALPRDIAEDAGSDLVVAVLDGTISLDQIETSSRTYGNRVLDKFASRFGPRSIDETIPGTDDLRMVDMIRDESSSEWLEEMGATVW